MTVVGNGRGRRPRTLDFRGEQLTYREISDRTGVPVDQLRARASRGAPLDAPFQPRTKTRHQPGSTAESARRLLELAGYRVSVVRLPTGVTAIFVDEEEGTR